MSGAKAEPNSPFTRDPRDTGRLDRAAEPAGQRLTVAPKEELLDAELRREAASRSSGRTHAPENALFARYLPKESARAVAPAPFHETRGAPILQADARFGVLPVAEVKLTPLRLERGEFLLLEVLPNALGQSKIEGPQRFVFAALVEHSFDARRFASSGNPQGRFIHIELPSTEGAPTTFDLPADYTKKVKVGTEGRMARLGLEFSFREAGEKREVRIQGKLDLGAAQSQEALLRITDISERGEISREVKTGMGSYKTAADAGGRR